MDRYQGQLLIAHFVVGKWKGRQLGWTGQILWCYQGCEERFLQDVSSKEFIINFFLLVILRKRRKIFTFFAAGSFASCFASARRLCNFSWFFAFFDLRTTSSRLILFFIRDGSKRLVGMISEVEKFARLGGYVSIYQCISKSGMTEQFHCTLL